MNNNFEFNSDETQAEPVGFRVNADMAGSVWIRNKFADGTLNEGVKLKRSEVRTLLVAFRALGETLETL